MQIFHRGSVVLFLCFVVVVVAFFGFMADLRGLRKSKYEIN